MKLATFVSAAGTHRIGIVRTEDRKVFDLTTAASIVGDSGPTSTFSSMLNLIEAGPRALDSARDWERRYRSDEALALPFEAIKFLAPVPVPMSIRDFVAFPGHILNAPVALRTLAAKLGLGGGANSTAHQPEEVPEVYRRMPNFYKGNRFTVVGTEAEVRRPRDSQYLDYELEFGVFIGRGGMDVSKANAKHHIFGYSIFNDFSARDIQVREMGGMTGPCKSKDFATGNAIGPWIVTADEVSDPYSLAMTSRVNGEVWCAGTSAKMLHSFEDMIAYISRDEPIVPGEFLGSGTVGGGTGMEINKFLQDADVIELEVEGLGVLRNRVAPAQAS